MAIRKIKLKLGDSLGILTITIMAAMVGFTILFIYSNINLKNKITYKIIQQTDLITNLLTGMTVDILGTKHTSERYGLVLKYGEIIGVNEIGIYTLKGEEAFGNIPPDGKIKPGLQPGNRRGISAEEMPNFRKSVETAGKADFFDHKRMTYSGYIPLRNKGTCTECHMNEGEILGILSIKLSTEDDFALLNGVQRLIWGLAFIILIPVIGMFVALIIFRDLSKSNKALKNTFDSLHETKSYIQLILDNSKAIIITTDKDGKIVEFNKEAQNLFEYTKEEVTGQSVLLLYQDPTQRLEIMKNQALFDNVSWAVKNKEVVLKSKTGKLIHINLTLSALMDNSGNVIGTVGVGKDITEQKMLQFKLLQSEKMAGIGILASGIAHEINNPLAGILGMAEAIRDETDPAKMKTYSSDIIQYTLDASNIVKELSSYSRHARNESQSTVDLAAILEYSLKMARHSASLMSIEVKTNFERNSYIFANEGEIQQVFVNLMVNAIHAMEEKGTLTLACCTDGDIVRATISDTGHGISKEDLKYIFDPFFTTKPVGKGTGLGLYVAYKIVTKYGGSIDIDTKEGVGTAFTLKFPAVKAAGIA